MAARCGAASAAIASATAAAGCSIANPAARAGDVAAMKPRYSRYAYMAVVATVLNPKWWHFLPAPGLGLFRGRIRGAVRVFAAPQ